MLCVSCLWLSARPIAWAYLILIAAAVVRVFGPWLLPFDYRNVVAGAGLLWSAAFLIYAVVYTPILLRPRVDGKPG